MKKSVGKTILHTQIETRLMQLAKREAAERRIPLRAVVEAALAERYDPEHAKAEEMLVLKELRSLRNEVRNVHFGNQMLVELTTLTTKNLFARLPAATPASNAAGEGFYNALIASVERVFSGRTPLLDKLTASLMRAQTDSEFDALQAATGQTDNADHDPEAPP
ncbi:MULTISPECIES: hypothetical protein [Xanthomonas]|uniref:Arc-like DNA binding domain-containing protein n=1 Tax=Xanthomonas vesicatoria TaxID=56460 RepID=A0ABS8L618_9XANT|nr:MULTISPECIES: hypothetical protein [Xanthomonas]MCC4631436.1 hypothetical protein [Xanthomonas citri]MCC8620645.1 hypothetical protein [Xanthomonas vesicatoria]MCC8692426.1 hypothetical protein [Xanthomonas vesicatoria]MCC8700707.1 hypothetical protein [Xanthomonas vesicatoria]NMI15748.1 hypothetical protein [Xanthomonas citri]